MTSGATRVPPVDVLVVAGLQALVAGVPLLVGGRHPWALLLGVPLVLALLATTVWQRTRAVSPPHAPGVAALAAFVGLGLVTVLPLPPVVLGALSPATADLYARVLPGWPDGAAWSSWRTLAFDPYAVSLELMRVGIGFGAFAVLVAYPWSEEARQRAVRRLVLTLLVTGVVFAVVTFLEEVAGNGYVLWVSGIETAYTRPAGPFVCPNHFAAWLEMLLPVAAAYAASVAVRTWRRVHAGASSGRVAGVLARRAWAASLIANQRPLWAPLVLCAAVAMLVGAHIATDSRGGRLALIAGAAFTSLGALAAFGPRGARRAIRRQAPVIALGVVAIAGLWFARLAGEVSEGAGGSEQAQAVDLDVGSRLAASALGWRVFRDHPLAGTGLGSWLHAFRPYQAPPIETGIWDHAHNDYVELAGETGVMGLALVLLLGVAVIRACHGGPARGAGVPAAPRPRRHRHRHGFGEEEGDWSRALRDPGPLRWGIAGGLTAVLVHSFVDFGLRMPANMLLAMTLLGLLTLTGRGRPGRAVGSPVLLLVLLALAAVAPARNALRVARGAPPLEADALLEHVDLLVAESDDGSTAARAVALVRDLIDRSPANGDAHVALADALGPGPEGDAALRHAIALDPTAIELRDQLAVRLWEQGDHRGAAREVEDAIARAPFLAGHVFLLADSPLLPAKTVEQKLADLSERDGITGRLRFLDPRLASAIERGLTAALARNAAGDDHDATFDDLVTLHEARREWREAGRLLRAEAEAGGAGIALLARAASDFLELRDYAAAEEALLEAVNRAPEDGALYRRLAVDVYAAQGRFTTAETVLEAGERHADDAIPIYRGLTEVLARRESDRTDRDVLIHESASRDEPSEEGSAAMHDADETDG